MSGWSAESPEHDPPAAGAGWSDAPPPGPPASAPTPPPEAPPSDAAWALPEVGLVEPTVPGAPTPGPAGTGPAAAGPGSAPAAGSGPGGWDDSPEPVAPPVLPVVLGPMTFTDILDGAWGIIKARPRTVFAITAMIMLPAGLIEAALTHGQSSLAEIILDVIDGLGSSRTRAGSGTGAVVLAVLVHNLSLFLLGGAIARLVSSWYAGGDLSARQAAMASVRKAPSLVGAFAVLLPIKVVAWAVCALGIPFVVPPIMVTAPAIVVEDLGPIAGPLRSLALARRRYWPCVGVWALAFTIEQTVNVALRIVPGLISSVTPGVIAPVVAAAGTIFATFVTAPFVVGVAVLLYLDLRVRTEGLDLELDATAAFARAA